MTGTDTPRNASYAAAIYAAGLPAWMSYQVAVNSRRKAVGATMEPTAGGVVVRFGIPAAATPAAVTDAVRRMRAKLVRAGEDIRERGARIIRKELVNGEGFRFAGRNYRLRLTDDPAAAPLVAGPGPSTWSGVRTWQLTVRRDAATADTIIGWYRQAGRAWLDEQLPAIIRHAGIVDWPTWRVRPYRAGLPDSWGRYTGRTHSIGLSWVIFQFPPELLRHILVHEVAHAATAGDGHGKRWQAKMAAMSGAASGWRDLDRQARALPGVALWTGDVEPTDPPAPAAGPYVSAWAHSGGSR